MIIDRLRSTTSMAGEAFLFHLYRADVSLFAVHIRMI